MANDGPLRISEASAGYWRVTLDNPPINLFDPEVFAALRLLLDQVESDETVRVLVFDSADPDYYISHLDVARVEEVPAIPGGANLADEWHHFVTRLARSSVLSIASIRGRVRGIGNEFVLACDMRFASAEKAILGQAEVGFGLVARWRGVRLATTPGRPIPGTRDHRRRRGLRCRDSRTLRLDQSSSARRQPRPVRGRARDTDRRIRATRSCVHQTSREPTHPAAHRGRATAVLQVDPRGDHVAGSAGPTCGHGSQRMGQAFRGRTQPPTIPRAPCTRPRG